ncbi:flavin reductase family protein [Pseudonocardia sp. N23]|uniref:flavin reductase family protein n=1 Tax=Pseudonocardia sp. N23 TaxID=1987376 RepID=UPI000BFE0565|nr:flavin reductase family protein [Pseudonocardia sp. N23]GAY07668.1 nitrilotriacetate monooxygenase component B [Pseudonocardia sp. N23]
MPTPDQLDGSSYRRVISDLATGVTVITTVDEDGKRCGMTANAVTSLSLSPAPQLLVCVSGHLPMHAALTGSGRFAVNVLDENQENLAMHFARPSADKFADLETHSEHGVPILSDAMAWFACDVVERYPGGDHSIFIGRVVSCRRNAARRPLLFFQSSFGCLGSHEGTLEFANSMMRM